MLQLQRNAPLPAKTPLKPSDGRKKYPFDKMTQVGDFFFIPGKQRDSIRTYFSTVGKRRGIKLRSEQIHAREVEDGWEQCPDDTPGAVMGVGVWRTE